MCLFRDLLFIDVAEVSGVLVQLGGQKPIQDETVQSINL
jgi:hypothetical protein